MFDNTEQVGDLSSLRSRGTWEGLYAGGPTWTRNALSRITGIHGGYRAETSPDQELPNGKLGTSKSQRQCRRRYWSLQLLSPRLGRPSGSGIQFQWGFLLGSLSFRETGQTLLCVNAPRQDVGWHTRQPRSATPLKRAHCVNLKELSRAHFLAHHCANITGLSSDQYLFGDCGAFTYVNEKAPTISVDQAVALYESYGFDLGASVDHIPVPVVRIGDDRVELPVEERQERVNLTRENARLFIDSARERKVGFIPVGTIQALNPEQYAQFVRDYYEFGYRHLAIGGLVPQRDIDIEKTIRAVMQVAQELPERPWIHLFGIYRPRLQQLFRHLKVDSFDSASYFRKAWLRSDQNYLSSNGQWYAALRVPMTSDGRTRNRLQMMDANIEDLQVLEREVLRLLSQYDDDQVTLSEVLEAVLHYDSYLARSSETESMRAKYRRTLVDRPWRSCHCNFCESLGIHMLIFRGANRNKRRGAHNILMLYGDLTQGTQDAHGQLT